MIINGTNFRHARSAMSVFLDGHVTDSRPVLSINVEGEIVSVDIAGNISAIKPQICMTVPLPVRDWRLLDGWTFDDSFPGATCLAWGVQPQMADMESFKCLLRSRSSRTFFVELTASLMCYDFSRSGALVSISVIEPFTLDSVSVGIPGNSESPIEDASSLLAKHLEPDAVSIPTLHCRHGTDKDDILAYEVDFPTAL
jgi:prepilin-type processing-associated H-X9-DG protein